jgi:hypothetical protein
MLAALRTAWSRLVDRRLNRRVRRNLHRCPQCQLIAVPLEEHYAQWLDAQLFGHDRLTSFHGRQVDRLQTELDTHRERDHAPAAV